MSLLPDPDVLVATANRLDDYAEQLRARAATLAARTQNIRWVSAAAGAFQRQSLGISADLRCCADRVEDAAYELRAHARTVRREVEILHTAAGAVRAVTSGVTHEVTHGVSHAGHELAALAGLT